MLSWDLKDLTPYHPWRVVPHTLLENQIFHYSLGLLLFHQWFAVLGIYLQTLKPESKESESKQ
jgi:hypothetical protein